MQAANKLQYGVNFYIHWETKKFIWLALLQYSLYSGDLELNMQYPQVCLAECQKHEWLFLPHISM